MINLKINFEGYPCKAEFPLFSFVGDETSGDINLTFYTKGFEDGDFAKSAKSWLDTLKDALLTQKLGHALQSVEGIVIKAHSAGCLQALEFLNLLHHDLISNQDKLDDKAKKLFGKILNATVYFERPLHSKDHLQLFSSLGNEFLRSTGDLGNSFLKLIGIAKEPLPPFLETSNFCELMKKLAEKRVIKKITITIDGGDHNSYVSDDALELEKLLLGESGVIFFIGIARNDEVVKNDLFLQKEAESGLLGCAKREKEDTSPSPLVQALSKFIDEQENAKPSSACKGSGSLLELQLNVCHR